MRFFLFIAVIVDCLAVCEAAMGAVSTSECSGDIPVQTASYIDDSLRVFVSELPTDELGECVLGVHGETRADGISLQVKLVCEGKKTLEETRIVTSASAAAQARTMARNLLKERVDSSIKGTPTVEIYNLGLVAPGLSNDLRKTKRSYDVFLLETGVGFGLLLVTNLEFERSWTGGPFVDFLWGIPRIRLGLRLSMPVAVVPYGNLDGEPCFGHHDDIYNSDYYKNSTTFFFSYSLLMRVGIWHRFGFLCGLGIGHVASAEYGVYSVFPNFYANVGIEFLLVKTETIDFGVRLYLDYIKLFNASLFFPQIGVVFAI